jgi:hypothetical protein
VVEGDLARVLKERYPCEAVLSITLTNSVRSSASWLAIESTASRHNLSESCMDEPNSVIDVGFLYQTGRAHPDLGDVVKSGLLFFDQLALKAETVDLYNADHLVEPLQDRGLLEIVAPEEIMTPDALELQNDILLSLVREGVFDYLGEDRSYDFFISPRPLRYLTYPDGEHRAFLTPVGEELIRRKLAVPYESQIPEELRGHYERRGYEVDSDFLNYRWRTIDDLSLSYSSRMPNPYLAFPASDISSWRPKDARPIDFDGRTFIRLAVHEDVAFLHEQIVGMIAYSSSTSIRQYHPFTHISDREVAKRFLGRLPGSAYAKIVATDLEQVAVDLGDVPFDDLLAFKDQHRSQFVEYRTGLASAIREISLSEDATEREALLFRRQEECAVLARDLKRACRQAFGVKLGATALGAVGMAWSLGHGDAVQAMLAAASAGLSVKAITVPYSHIRYLYDVQGWF